MSHSVRVRGLKPLQGNRSLLGEESHSVRVRGLKPLSHSPVIGTLESHSVRVRGLKQLTAQIIKTVAHVALRASAWIETFVGQFVSSMSGGRTPCECVD